ncbi:MAG: deoxyribodipyrimidine photo-lyase, partial [Hyphomicrobiaceae bacterium]|nr:deoxyribodipyrimidine photo-lyase [Hyphomicrobiaceae bacterium]
MPTRPVIVWFRQDLRLADNMALLRAAETGAPVLPLYVLDDVTPGPWRMGGASRWWLHHSLTALAADLAAIGAPLTILAGAAEEVLPRLAAETGADTVTCSRSYEPWARALEQRLHARLEAAGVKLRRYAGTLLREPEEVATGSGGPYKVYTPFWRAIAAKGPPRSPLAAPARLTPPPHLPKGVSLADLALLPMKPDWARGMREAWTPGEAGARARLAGFLASALAGYQESRNRPDKPGTSRLSPHLHFGEVSPATVWHATEGTSPDAARLDADRETFLKELTWREFSAHLLFHFPDLPETPFRAEFGRFPWREDEAGLAAWQKGRTG